MTESIFKIYPLEPTRGFTSIEIDEIKNRLLYENAHSILKGSIEIHSWKGIMFIDCGNRLESLYCPKCGKQVEMEFWQEQMRKDYSEETGFSLSSFKLPCCDAITKLQALRYEKNCGFSNSAIYFSVFTHIWLNWIREYPWLGIVEANS